MQSVTTTRADAIGEGQETDALQGRCRLLRSAMEEEKRYTVQCLHNAKISPRFYTGALEARWRRTELHMALEYLKSPDVEVTNKSDKEQQINKIQAQFAQFAGSQRARRRSSAWQNLRWATQASRSSNTKQIIEV